jgi:hypothetical protein
MVRLPNPFRKKMAPPYEPQRSHPKWPGAYWFTLRSVPRHHDGIKAAIESSPQANVWFSEPLAYLRGQGVSLFRVEARDLSFLQTLDQWWAETERLEAFSFDISLYFNNVDFVCSLRDKTPDEMRRIIEDGAPRVPDNPADASLQLTTSARL